MLLTRTAPPKSSHGALILLFTMMAWLARADTKMDPDMIPLGTVAQGMKIFERQHGRLPVNWAEIGSVLDVQYMDQYTVRTSGYRLQERYRFVSDDIPMFENSGWGEKLDSASKILIARTEPFYDFLGNPSNWPFVYRRGDGSISEISIPSSKVQLLERLSGKKITIAASAGQRRVLNPLTISTLVAGVLFVYWLRARKVRRKQDLIGASW
jgi:hypothetical protein